MEQQRPTGGASNVRSDLILEMARLMSADRSDPGRPYRDMRVALGNAIDGAFHDHLSFATGTPDLAFAVARGEIALAVVNPSAYLSMAYKGTGPFPEPLPVRAIGVMPSWDRMAFAVAGRCGIGSLAEVRDRRYPLKVSIRGNVLHATRFVVDEALAALNFSLADIESWGGSFQYVDTPSHPDRMRGMEDGTIDAVFDEGVKGWGSRALQVGMRFLPLDAPVASRFNQLGWPLGPLARDRFPDLERDIADAPSFSGWPLFTSAELPENTAYQMVAALDGARGKIPFDHPDPVTLADIAGGTDAAPRDVPLHPGAERYYREHGALG